MSVKIVLLFGLILLHAVTQWNCISHPGKCVKQVAFKVEAPMKEEALNVSQRRIGHGSLVGGPPCSCQV